MLSFYLYTCLDDDDDACRHRPFPAVLPNLKNRLLICRENRPKNCVGPAEDYHGSNTVFLVLVLMSVVGGVFIIFATMALCYRSVVVHKNFTLCLRLVSRTVQVEIHNSQHPIYRFLFLTFYCVSAAAEYYLQCFIRFALADWSRAH